MPKKIGYLGALCIAFFAFYPALVHAGLPQGADVTLHYWKTVELEHIWSQGEILPRWAENFYYGYGAPTFQFTAPGPYGLAVLLGKLPLVDDVIRLKLLWLIALIFSSIGTFHYAARRWGAASGLVAAAAFTFAPAIVYVEPIGRASYPAVFGLGCMAASLALLDEYAHTRRFLLPLTFCLAGMLLSHNVTAVTGAALLAGWLLWQIILKPTAAPYLRQTLIVFALICGLTGFFWIPVAFERANASIDRLRNDPLLDYRIHFEPLRTLLLPTPLFDMNLWGQFGKRSLGFVSWILAIAGTAVLGGRFFRRKSHHHDLETLYWFLAGAMATFLVIPQSEFLWANVQLLETFQFPIRFLNIAALPLALLAGYFAAFLMKRPGILSHAWLVLLLALGIQGLRSTPNRYSNTFPRAATTADYFDHEINSGILGTTAANEFLPADVVSIPPPTGFLLDSLTGDGPAMRINPYVYPGDVQFEILESKPSRYRFTISTPHEQRVELYLFRYPGWEATLDGEPFPTESNGDFNFTILFIPPGDHTVEISYPLTGPQSAGLALSIFSLVALIGWRWRYRPQVETSEEETFQPLNRAQVYGLGAVAVIGLIGITIFMREGIAWVDSKPGDALLAPHQTDITFADGEIQLMGYDMLEVQADKQLRLGLYYYFAPSFKETVNAFVHLIDANGNIVAQSDKLDLGGIRNDANWNDTMHLRDQTILWLPENLPSGDYRLRTGLWACRDEINTTECNMPERLPVKVNGQPAPEDFTILEMVIHIG